MKLGICTSIDQAAAAQAAGFDFVEENIQNLLQGQLPDAQWKGADQVRGAPLATPAACCLLPGALKIVGPTVDSAAIRNYIEAACRRAKTVGIKTFVFGSGAARAVPDGWDKSQARAQITDFLKMAAPLAQAHDVTIVIEPLNTKETNIITTVPEAMQYVRAINHPAVKCLVDSYHFWLENESLADLAQAMPSIHHVHVSDLLGRLPSGQSREPGLDEKYRAFFKVIKAARYDGPVSVEAIWKDPLEVCGAAVTKFIKEQWAAA